MPKKSRDNVYWRKRLQAEHPAIYERLERGDIPSVSAAREEAKLKRQPSPMFQLKKLWDRATEEERREFLTWVGVPVMEAPPAPSHAIATSPKSKSVRRPKPAPAKTTSPTELFDRFGKLRPDIRDRIHRCLVLKGHYKGGAHQTARAMEKMGFSPYDPRLGNAIKGAPVMSYDGFIAPLAKWLADTEAELGLAAPE